MKPSLKDGVDVQLQTAFANGNWPLAARLAESRLRMTKDPYYEIVQVCAQCQVDEPSTKFAAVAAVSRLLRDKHPAAGDFNALNLLEWASKSTASPTFFEESIGPLRAQAVKGRPKDKHAASQSLESCLTHWDLRSAQQIAAVLDRSYPDERRYLFWNIALTYLLSTSDQAEQQQKRLYGTLALKQIQKAAQVAEQVKPDDRSVSSGSYRGIRTAEEKWLLYQIVETHGSEAEYEALAYSQKFGPLNQLRQGDKTLFAKYTQKLAADGNWARIYSLCEDALLMKTENGTLGLLACDHDTLELLVTAAGHACGSDARKKVGEILSTLLSAPGLSSIHRRNILLARVNATFTLLPKHEATPTSDGSNKYLLDLCGYIRDQWNNPSCFEDISRFLDLLDHDSLRLLVHELLPKVQDEKELHKAGQWRVLLLKVEYLASTTRRWENGLGKLRSRIIDFYEEANASSSPRNPTVSTDLALLAAFCDIRLGTSEHLLHATLLLEHQLSLDTSQTQLCLMLMQLHLALGSVKRARELWDGLAVKRSTIDVLAPLFYDRLSTVAPKMLSPIDDMGWKLMDTFVHHYEQSLKTPMHRRLVDTLYSEAYSSMIEIPCFVRKLRWSTTRAISLVEESRVGRLNGLAQHDVFSDCRFNELVDTASLHSKIDYGAFPAWDSQEAIPIHVLLRYGPSPSARRVQCGLITEAFHDLWSDNSTTPGYKVPRLSTQGDCAFAAETLGQLSNTLDKLLLAQQDDLTPAEATCYELLSGVCLLIELCSNDQQAPGVIDPVISQLLDAVVAGLAGLGACLPKAQDEGIEHVAATMRSMHTIGMCREAASIVQIAMKLLNDLRGQEKEQANVFGGRNQSKALSAKIESVQQSAGTAATEAQDCIASLGGYTVDHLQSHMDAWLLRTGCMDEKSSYKGQVRAVARHLLASVGP
ncbi:N-acetyltransferase B complex non catalytic subunit-domain-containing protein [Emericellopsis atlantica]|uniref:N-acetyltransferase B complex non catalytic subunit-domain-containing protein n=1 Tax=Emericellopsis atlantica TaxID=2614577 RepID=A0A9P8CLF2_9HYPO|nr:N-acetyltransferase B complex non catalytic subunit-domain-containing protein [Emericellopsis atlantica]KAG9249556.1 N-acetyltransferase B complex non catalytic subunit-domain-containing protein [Emericellopsis atlantica]